MATYAIHIKLAALADRADGPGHKMVHTRVVYQLRPDAGS